MDRNCAFLFCSFLAAYLFKQEVTGTYKKFSTQRNTTCVEAALILSRTESFRKATTSLFLSYYPLFILFPRAERRDGAVSLTSSMVQPYQVQP